MQSILWVLPLLAKSQDYSFIRTECDGEQATVVLEYIGTDAPDWGVFETARAGNCVEGQAGELCYNPYTRLNEPCTSAFERTYSSDNSQMMVTFDPYACSETTTEPADVTSYNVDTEVTFGESADTAVVINGKTLGMGGGSGFYWMMQAQCTFASSYTTSADFHVTQNTGESASYNLGAAEQLLEFEVHGTDELFQTLRGDDEYTTDDIVYHLVGLGSDLDGLSSGNAWAFPERDIWKNFHVAPTAVKVKSSDSDWYFDLLTSEMETCGYSQIGFRAVGFYEDPEEENPMGTFAWGIAYRGFTADNADASDLTLEVTLALCHKDDPNSACVAVLEKCSERQINIVIDTLACEDRPGYDIDGNGVWEYDGNGECQASAQRCNCPNGTGAFSPVCESMEYEFCSACNGPVFELETVHYKCESAPDTRSIEDISNSACFLTVPDNHVTWVNGEFAQFEGDSPAGGFAGGTIGTKHADQMQNYPTTYDSNTHCEWTFMVPAGKQLMLIAETFSVEPHQGCDYDRMMIWATNTPDTPDSERCIKHDETIAEYSSYRQLACSFCSQASMYFETSETNPFTVPNPQNMDQKVVVRFISDGETENGGIDLRWFID